jgi:4'-phosphopantetheinyl transferase
MTLVVPPDTCRADGVEVAFRELRGRDRVARRAEARSWAVGAIADRLGRPPSTLELERRCGRCGRNHGRPELAGDLAGSLRFSWSHGDRIAALAIVEVGRVGIDLEPIRPVAFLASMLSADERARAGAEPLSDAALLRLWVRKEALVKASGLGLYLNPSSITADLDGAAVTVPADRGGTVTCDVIDVEGPDGSVVAVAVERGGRAVR